MWLSKREIKRRYQRQLAVNAVLVERIDWLEKDAARAERGHELNASLDRHTTRRSVLASLREIAADYGGLIETAATIAILRAGWRTGKALVP